MPLGPGVRYRVTTRGGKKIRLAFRGKKVIEVKDLKTGKTHKMTSSHKKRKVVLPSYHA